MIIAKTSNVANNDNDDDDDNDDCVHEFIGIFKTCCGSCMNMNSSKKNTLQQMKFCTSICASVLPSVWMSVGILWI